MTSIPEFPKFKRLELKDRSSIEKITEKFPHHSDFNFVSMWSWDTKEEVEISKLNNNLVVKFTDYLTGNPFFSFLGHNKVSDTAEKLISLSQTKHNKGHLKYIFEETVNNHVDKDNFEVIADSASHDYVYAVSHLANMHKWSKHTSGKNVRRFVKEFNQYSVEHFDLENAPVEKCMKLLDKWTEGKGLDKTDLNEYKAVSRMFKSNIKNLKVVTLSVNNELVGFTIYEVVTDEYAVSHFAKADNQYHKSIGDVLNWEEAKILHAQGIKHFNWEEDLGIEGLRKFKEKYKPAYLLKKYKVKKNNKNKGSSS